LLTEISQKIGREDKAYAGDLVATHQLFIDFVRNRDAYSAGTLLSSRCRLMDGREVKGPDAVMRVLEELMMQDGVAVVVKDAKALCSGATTNALDGDKAKDKAKDKVKAKDKAKDKAKAKAKDCAKAEGRDHSDDESESSSEEEEEGADPFVPSDKVRLTLESISRHLSSAQGILLNCLTQPPPPPFFVCGLRR
jgi:hypothetical protein